MAGGRRGTKSKAKRRSGGSRSGRKNNSGKSRAFKNALTAVLIVAAIFACWQGAMFLIQSHVDPDNPVQGVDVSSYQEEIDWEGLKSEGYAFAYIKATEGSSHVDPAFEQNWKGAAKAGLKRGAYHFLSFDTDGQTQAENYIETVHEGINGILPGRGMLPPAIDIELYDSYESAPPSQERLDEVLQPLLEQLEERYGLRPVLYTNPYIYEKYLSEAYSDYKIWISDPDVSDTLPDGRDWTFCQYTFEGSSPYVDDGAKDVDLNYFKGSLWDLRHLR